MKKFLADFVKGLYPETSRPAKWNWIGGTDGGVQCYIDNDSIERTGNCATIWVKWVFHDKSYDLAKCSVDRSRHAYAVAAGYFYGASGNFVGQRIPEHLNWIPIEPGSMVESIYQIIWAN